MEKIKLEWENWRSNTFNLKGISNLKFGVYEALGEVHLYSNYMNPDKESTLGFPQETRITSTEQGRQFCQDWLDALVEKENRIERVQKVLEDIWGGKTNLVWEKETVEYMKDNFKAKFLYQNKQYEFYWHFKNTLCIYDSKNYNARDFQFPNQSVRTLEECKTICQDWYNKYLLDQASK